MFLFFYLEKIKCWPEANELTTVISAIFSTRVKISSLRQAMHICSAYTNRIDDRENHIGCISRCTRSSRLVNQVERRGAGNISNATGLWQDTSANTHAHTTAWGFSQKQRQKKMIYLTDTCPHSLTVGHCIKKKKLHRSSIETNIRCHDS